MIKFRRVELMGRIARSKKKKHVTGISFRKPEGKRNLGKLTGSWKRNITVLIKETR
jgi:hypothetical protein